MQAIQQKIIKHLIENHTVTSESVAFNLGVSSRTIRRHINQLQEELLMNGAEIITKPSVGISLVIYDQNKFENFMTVQTHSKNIPSTPNERIDYLLNELIHNNKYIKLEEVASEIYISQNRLQMDLKQIKEIILPYNLKIESKPNYGVKIKGSESDKRNFLVEYFYHKDNLIDSLKSDYSSHYESIYRIVVDILHHDKILMSDIAVQNLCIHLFIAIDRIQCNQIVNLTKETIESSKTYHEYQISVNIAQKIKERLSIEIPEEEICYCALHLVGKRHYDQASNRFHEDIDEMLVLYINLILRNIYKKTNLDFFNDSDLKNNLALHLIPFLERINNNLKLKNPLLYDIKSKYGFAYEIASIGLSALLPYLNKPISEDEVSYFALHFMLALEKKKENKSRYNLLVICNSGKATSQLLAYQFQQKYGNIINSIKIMSAHALDHFNTDSFDFIFTTVPLNKNFNIPVVKISNILNDDDFEVISNQFNSNNSINIHKILRSNLFFPNIQAENKEEAIHKLIDLTGNIINIPDYFEDYVLERERISSTELNNFIAIPHPIKAVCDTTFISIGILKKPILWKKQQVQIMFLISVSENDMTNLQDFYKTLFELISDKNGIHKLLQTNDYNSFMEVLLNK